MRRPREGVGAGGGDVVMDVPSRRGEYDGMPHDVTS